MKSPQQRNDAASQAPCQLNDGDMGSGTYQDLTGIAYGLRSSGQWG